MPDSLGFLFVTMEPPPTLEGEFQDWYDTEHMPERVTIPGFLNALRFVCVEGWPRYAAFYDLARHQVLNEPGYLAVSGDRFSPWSKRVLSRVAGLYRADGIQVFPGNAVTGAQGNAPWLIVWRFRVTNSAMDNDIISGLHKIYGGVSGLLQFRLFRTCHAGAMDHIALVEMQAQPTRGTIDAEKFGAAANCIDVINTYRRYWRREA